MTFLRRIDPDPSAGAAEGGSAPGLLLFGRDRVFSVGRGDALTGPKRMGAAVIYAAPEGAFELSLPGRPARRERCAILAPYAAHRLTEAPERLIAVLLEPETLGAAELRRLLPAGEIAPGTQALARRMERAASRLAAGWDGAAETLDAAVFGRPLARRALDPRIARALARLEEGSLGEGVRAGELAAEARLSRDHFLRLFRAETGCNFCSVKSWKRGRRFLSAAKSEANLTRVALELGYPDSSYFCNSIRRIFGKSPGAMRSLAEDFAIREAGLEAPAP